MTDLNKIPSILWQACVVAAAIAVLGAIMGWVI